jgi:hypothetical protein
MDKLKRLVLLVGLIFLTVCIVGLAFPNEPDGFRDLKWGDAPTKYMDFYLQMVGENIDKGNIYKRKNDKKSIGSVEFYDIEYTFNLRSNQLYKIEATCSELNDVKLNRDYNILKTILVERYGEPTRTLEKWLCWEGDKTNIYIYYNSEKGYWLSCRLIFESVKICQEDLPEINIEKEIEKAKTDF